MTERFQIHFHNRAATAVRARKGHIMLRTLILAGALIAVPAAAHEFTLGSLTIDHPWSRATPPGANVAAGYMRIENADDTPVTLVGGEADFADIEIHTMEVTDGVMRMAELPDGLTIAPGESVTLEPGGFHVMFVNLDEPFVEGEDRSATLDFGEAGTVTVDFSVAGMGATHHHGAKD